MFHKLFSFPFIRVRFHSTSLFSLRHKPPSWRSHALAHPPNTFLGDELADAIARASSPRELQLLLHTHVYTHPLCLDLLNGHGFRVFILQHLTRRCSKSGEIQTWFDFLRFARQCDFKLTRTNIALALESLKQFVLARFKRDGRDPRICTNTLQRAREILFDMAKEDGVPIDYVLYTRALQLLHNLLAVYDRQNVYRTTFPLNDLPRREGIVPEWVVPHSAKTMEEFSDAIKQCDAFVDELMKEMRENSAHGTRPPFSFMLRLADYYFATDNVHGMLSVLEDCSELGVAVAESTTAKLMQLASAFNLPQTPALFIHWRASPRHCVLAAPDMSRLMFYFARSGGGLPCPECHDTFNHRNVRYASEANNTSCSLLQLARTRKGELEERSDVPQCRDWSNVALRCFEFSRARAISWGFTEWRAFLLCCMHTKNLDTRWSVLKLIQQHFPRSQWDDFLAVTFLRFLKRTDPALIYPTMCEWDRLGMKRSPLALQEAVLGLMRMTNKKKEEEKEEEDEERVKHVKGIVQRMRETDVYVMPMTKRHIIMFLLDNKVSETEQLLWKEVEHLQPRQPDMIEQKDSCSDISPGPTKKQQFKGI